MKYALFFLVSMLFTMRSFSQDLYPLMQSVETRLKQVESQGSYKIEKTIYDVVRTDETFEFDYYFYKGDTYWIQLYGDDARLADCTISLYNSQNDSWVLLKQSYGSTINPSLYYSPLSNGRMKMKVTANFTNSYKTSYFGLVIYSKL